MSTDAPRGEMRYQDRNDGVARKLAVLEEARKRGDYRLAGALADSLKDGLAAEALLATSDEAEAPGAPAQSLPAAGWRPVAELPQAWARWAAGWAWFQEVALDELAGLDREREPVDVVLAAPAGRCGSLAREVRVARVDREAGTLHVVPSQVYGEERSRGTGGTGEAARANKPDAPDATGESGVRSAHLVWLADVPAGGTALYVVFMGNPAAELPAYVTDMTVRGEGFALEIENEAFVASLSAQMGQLERLRYKGAHGVELFAGGEGHGEPPHIDWAHDYLASEKFQKFRVTNWETCRNYEVVRGPLCTIVRRWGFPHSPLHPVFTAARMLVDVRYVFYASAPYFLKDGRMEVVQDFALNYLRDDEWVFSGYSFTDLLWMDEDGGVREGAVPSDQAARMWGVGFYHRESRDAFFSIRLEHRLELAEDGAESEEEAGGSDGEREPRVTLHHADAPSLHYQGHGQLWSRWALRGDPQLRAGDKLTQRNAYLTEPYQREDGAARIEGWRRRLLEPLVVRAGEGVALPDAPTSEGRQEGHGTLAGPGEAPAASGLKGAIWRALREVPDDMFYTADANVADMGYVYDVRLRNGDAGGDVEVLLTMPHRGRPKYRYLGNPLAARLARCRGFVL